jgi:hypothetical protein
MNLDAGQPVRTLGPNDIALAGNVLGSLAPPPRRSEPSAHARSLREGCEGKAILFNFK